MGNLLAYSGITTKVKAMESKLITENQFREMAALGSVFEAVEYLKRISSYQLVFSGTEQGDLHRGDIEQMLALSQYHDFAKLYRFSNLTQRRFLDLCFMHYEISILKKCLRNVMGHKEFSLDLSLFDEFFQRHSRLHLMQLSSSENLTEFIMNLEGTPYYHLISNLSDSVPPTLFDIEMHLDLYYFKTVWKLKRKYLSKSEQMVLTTCYGSQLDLLNIQWIYRSNKYYHLPAADIYSLLIPISYRLRKGEITALVEAVGLDEFFQVLKTTYYGSISTFDLSEKPDLESLYEQLLYRVYLQTSRKQPYSIASLNSYLFFKEMEIQKIITIIECIRYGIPVDETIALVIKK